MSSLPLVVYLDTQDYIRVFNEPEDGPNHKIIEKLLSFRDKGEISIGYSWATMLEFITRPTDAFRGERVQRGQLVKDICGRCAFPYLTELKRGARFPNNGMWIPGQDGKLITANWYRSHLEKSFREAVSGLHMLNRNQRRQLRKSSSMRQLIKDNSLGWGKRREDFKGLPVSDELIESGVLIRFATGECSDAEFEERINRWLSDPAEYSRIIYDYGNKPNMIDEFLGAHINKMEAAFRQLQEAGREIDKFEEVAQEHRQKLVDMGVDKRTAKKMTPKIRRPKLDASDVVEMIERQLGEGRGGHFGHYMLKASRKGYRFKRSDFMDVMQMCYVPDCDLFRCDKAMADLYSDYEPFSGKLVSKFSDLPDRIEYLLNRQEK